MSAEHQLLAQHQSKNLSRKDLREQRLDELLTSCREQTLQSLVGPFGLTPAMFDDKAGGNVTTQHNAEKDIYAKDSEQFVRSDYQYDAAKSKKKKEAVKNGSMNSQEFTDAYTGQKAPTKRVDSNGKLVMNAELDHVVPVKEAHRKGGWMRDKEGRTQISSVDENLQYTTHKTNREKGAKSASEFLSGQNGFDETRTASIVENAQAAIDKELPSNKQRVFYHGKELLSTGVTEAGKTALRQAMGVLMYEFVNGSYVEVSRLIKQPKSEESLIDRIVVSLKRVLARVQSKLHAAFDALLAGGAQGFISNFLTFVINNIVTTSAKVVTIIREGTKGLWDAIKLIVSPPPHLSSSDVARQATKIIAAVITAGLGMLFEESVKGFLMSVPVLVPLADVLASVVTGILTGLMTALAVYSIDRLFDYLSAQGTEVLEAQMKKVEADAFLVDKLADFVGQQYQNSRVYADVARQNAIILAGFEQSAQNMSRVIQHAEATVETRALVIKTFAARAQSMRDMDDELDDLLAQYEIEEKEKND
jgi:hypothetical protein